MEEIKKCINVLKDGTKKMFKELFHKNTFKKQIANLLTFIRLMSAPIVLMFAILGMPIPAFVSALVGAATDWFDGKVARKTKSASRYGELLDQVTDKVFAILVGISVCVFNPLFLLSMLGEGAIAAINLSYQAKNKDLKIKSTYLAKVKQWPLFISFALGFLAIKIPGLSIATNSLIGITFATQIATGINYIKVNEDKIKSIEKEKEFNKQEEISNEEELENNLENTKNKSNTNYNSISIKKEELIKLKKELIEDKENIKEEGNYQKTKK